MNSNPIVRPGQSAFPTTSDRVEAGLTKREYFAAIALQGLLACPNISGDPGKVTNSSVIYADALIDALNKTSTP